MDQLIANLESTHIDAPLRSDLDHGFVFTLDKAFSFKDGNVKVVGTVNEPWFRAKDLLRCMGYSMERSHIVKHLSKIDDNFKTRFENICVSLNIDTSVDKSKRQIDRLNGNKEIYINKQGIAQLFQKCRILQAREFINFFIQEFDINLNVISESKEQRTLNPIITLLKRMGYSCFTQKQVGTYKIDLFVENKNNKPGLAIECDEFNHNGRDKDYEQARENFIIKELNCIIYRFNPDCKMFNVMETSGDILNILLK